MKGLSPQRASLLFGLFFAIGIGMKPLAGAAYDWIGIRYALFLIASVPGVSWLLLPFIECLWLLMLVTVLMAPILGTGAVTQTFMLGRLSDDIQGTVLGVVRTAAMTIGGLIPAVVGSMAERGYFDEAFLRLATVAGVLVVIAMILPSDRHWPVLKLDRPDERSNATGESPQIDDTGRRRQ